MALIECFECHNEISSNARSCPKCGNPLSRDNATVAAQAPTPEQASKKRGFFFYAGWAVFSVVGLFFGSAFVAAIVEGSSGRSRSAPSNAEIKTATKRIFATCEEQVLGHVQAEGERLTDAESTAIVKCIDVMSSAYIEGANAGRN